LRNAIYSVFVITVWGSTMGWLLMAKILPSFWLGEPPSTGVQSLEPVCWEVKIGDKHIGWAVSQCVPGASDTTEIHSRIVVEKLPLDRILPFDRVAPRWTVALLNRTSSLRLDMRSRTTLDSLDQLAMFETRVQVNELPTSFYVKGKLRGGSLEMRSQFGDQVHRFEYPWNRNAVLGSELMPDAKLLQLYVGRKWQREVYNPLVGDSGPSELIEAEVVEEEPIYFHGQLHTTRRIEYRSVNADGVSTTNRRRARLWVAEDGTVLREELVLMDLVLTFDRVPDDRTEQMAAELLDLNHYATLAPQEKAPRRWRRGSGSR
jgi:hypothetical protein